MESMPEECGCPDTVVFHLNGNIDFVFDAHHGCYIVDNETKRMNRRLDDEEMDRLCLHWLKERTETMQAAIKHYVKADQIRKGAAS